MFCYVFSVINWLNTICVTLVHESNPTIDYDNDYDNDDDNCDDDDTN